MGWPEIIFWSAVGFVGYGYAGNPLALGVVSLMRT